MTYKCDFCGKTHSDPAKYTECVQKCSESIGKKAQQIDDLKKQIKYHFDEYCRLSEELYVLAPNASSVDCNCFICDAPITYHSLERMWICSGCGVERPDLPRPLPKLAGFDSIRPDGGVLWEKSKKQGNLNFGKLTGIE